VQSKDPEIKNLLSGVKNILQTPPIYYKMNVNFDFKIKKILIFILKFF